MIVSVGRQVRDVLLVRRSRTDAEPSEPGTSATVRYANVAIHQEGRPIDSGQAIRRKSVVTLRISIGPRERDSLVMNPAVFPVVAPRTVPIQVLVSSTDFGFGTKFAASSSEATLYLPPIGRATTKGRETHLEVAMRAPSTDSLARARINYYYRDALVQSQLLEAAIGRAPGGVHVNLDYTATRDFDGLERIPERPRYSILMNDSPPGHTIVLHPPGKKANTVPAVFTVPNAVESVVDDLRREVTRVTESEVSPSKDKLIADLKALAPIGRKLHRLLLSQAQHEIPIAGDDSHVISIARPKYVRFTLPWTYVYEIAVEPGSPICPLVERWDGRSPLLPVGLRNCPYRHDIRHRSGVYCPFGFWGFGQTLEAPPPTKDTLATIPLGRKPRVVVGETQLDVIPSVIDDHIERIRRTFVNRAGSARFERRRSQKSVLAALERDLPVVYFLCHGYKPAEGSPDTWLGLGRTEFVTDDQIFDMAQRARDLMKPEVWGTTRPVVLINACHSLDIEPATLLGYVDVFSGFCNATGVIGTEVKVPQGDAMEWAETFFTEFLRPGGTAASALATARLAFLARGSLFGLVYTAHCWAHLSVV